MSSWNRSPPAPPKKGGNTASASPLLFSTNATDDVPTQLLNFFYTTLYCRKTGQPLAVNDLINNVSPHFAMFKDCLRDLSGVTYVDSLLVPHTPLQRHQVKLIDTVRATRVEEMAAAAKEFFELNGTTGKRVQEFLRWMSFPKKVDLAVFYQGADAVSIARPAGLATTVATYVRAVKAFQEKAAAKNKLLAPDSKGGAFSVVVVSADLKFVEEFRKAAAATDWLIYNFPPNRVQAAMGAKPTLRMREEAFTQTLAELVALQNVPAVLGRYDTTLGRLLYLTREEPTSCIPVDGVAEFKAF